MQLKRSTAAGGRHRACRPSPTILEVAVNLQSAEQRLEALSRRQPLLEPYLQELREIRALVVALVERHDGPASPRSGFGHQA